MSASTAGCSISYNIIEICSSNRRVIVKFIHIIIYKIDFKLVDIIEIISNSFYIYLFLKITFHISFYFSLKSAILIIGGMYVFISNRF